VPALPDVPGVIKLSFIQSGGGDADVVNRIYLHYTGTAPTGPDLDTFCDAAANAWGSNMSPQQAASIELTGVTAVDLTSASGAVGASTISHVGTRSGTGPGLATCLVVKEQIARRYRGGKPRVYVSCGTVGDFADINTWGTTFANDTADAFADMIDTIAAAGWTGAGTIAAVNVSYYSGFTNKTTPAGRNYNVPKLRVGGPVVDFITNYTPNFQMASQRRRNQQA